jgi:hypothetical protein
MTPRGVSEEYSLSYNVELRITRIYTQIPRKYLTLIALVDKE